jgi:hypothetical protein
MKNIAFRMQRYLHNLDVDTAWEAAPMRPRRGD